MNYINNMLERMINRGDIPNGFIDVGAHFGETAAIIKNMFPSKRVFSFEANPACEEILRQNASEYIICLLGKENLDAVPFFINPDDVTSTGCSIFKENTAYFTDATKVDLPMYRLDSIIPPEAHLDFLKLDVQGAEIEVMEGASGIMHSIRWIYLEASFTNYNENAPLFNDVYKYITSKGYTMIDIVDPTWVNNQLIQSNFLFERK